MEKVIKKYSNDQITIVWQPEICTHSKLCWTHLLSVFDPRKRPWIDVDGADSERIIEQVQRCPSGALSFIRHSETSLTGDDTAD